MKQPLFVLVLIASSLLNAAYYFPIIITAFFSGGTMAERERDQKNSTTVISGSLVTPEYAEEKDEFGRQEVPWHMLLPMAILATGCIIFALLPVNWPLELVKATTRILF